MPDHANWSPTRLRTEAIAAERSSRPAQAVELLEASLRRDPEDWKTLRLLASLLARLGRRQEAHEHYRHLAALYERDQHLAKAIAVWKILLAGEPGSVSVHVKLGELYALGGFRADAREHYGKALAACRASGRTREAALVEARIADLDEASDPGRKTSALPEARGPRQRTRARRRTWTTRASWRNDSPRAASSGVTASSTWLAPSSRRSSPASPTTSRRGPSSATCSWRPACHEEAALHQAALAKPACEPQHPMGDLEGLEVLDLDLELSPPRGGSPPGRSRRRVDERRPGDARSVAGDQVPRDDYETRYDLGIAYREMGLLDEAIAELQLASRGASRRIESTSLLAACLLDKGLPKLAIQWLERGLEAPGLRPEQALSLRYDLARAHEARGERELALEIYVELYGEDAGFRDVAEKLQRCES